MIVITTKLTRRKFVAAILVICIVACSTVVMVNRGKNSEITDVAGMKEAKLKNNEDRVLLLEGYGWVIDKEPLEFMEVKIPNEFDGVYNEYNEIQKKQGFDLSEYAGKRVMRYTYKINNHPSNEDGVVANIIVYKSKLIAGDVCSPKLGGFMHGLAREENVAESKGAETAE